MVTKRRTWAGLALASILAACVGDEPVIPDGSSSSGALGGSSSGSSGLVATDGGGSSSGSGGTEDAGGDGGGCPAPLAADLASPASVANQCGTGLLGPAQVAVTDLVGSTSYAGGTITPGRYDLVKLETNQTTRATSSQGVWVFDGVGGYAQNDVDQGVGGNTVKRFASGTTADVSGQLRLDRTCKADALPDSATISYSAFQQGCDAYFVTGDNDQRATYVRRHQ